MIKEEDFGKLMDVFRAGCDEHETSSDVKHSLIEFLTSRKSFMCEHKGGGEAPQPFPGRPRLIESLESDQKFQMFMEQFFRGLGNNLELETSGMF